MEKQALIDAFNTDIFFQSLIQSGESEGSDEDDDCSMNQYFCAQTNASVSYFADVGKSRQWIKEAFMDDSSDSDDEQSIDFALEFHQNSLRYRDLYHADPSMSKYMHYSSDLITGKNKWLNHYQTIKKKNFKKKGQLSRQGKYGKTNRDLSGDLNLHGDLTSIDAHLYKSSFTDKSHSYNFLKKRALSATRKRNVGIAALRKQIWKVIAKKDIPKAYRHHVQNQTTKLTLLKKASREASKKVRSKAHDSRLRARKEVVIARARRMTREAQLFWKKYVRVEKSQRKHAEKQALAQQRIDDELREVHKQQQKLKFLITQTELYAHFVSGKTLQNVTQAEELPAVNLTEKEILSRLDESHDDEEYYAESILNKERAMSNANSAFTLHKSKMKMFSTAAKFSQAEGSETCTQPKLLCGQLTGYQLVGLNWIYNLYVHGLNGILADDMGLGKTVQTIAFFAHLAERFDIWGPFLVIAPASTLNNWHQEFGRFLPKFKVLPYWGTTSERKVLRLFWNQKRDLKPASSAPFHVLITSYQLATSDVRYFQRVQWHYIVFDEAQALKSSNSIRWRTLLEFNCRNRLLLTGTPIQNTMAELWALLHFIMPTLFDNHAEFNEWFSKNIENHIDSKSSIAESDLSRLHMILKPFILRRLKCDVEHELTEKVEVRVLCQLSSRQRVLYDALQRNVLAKEILRAQSYTGHAPNNIVLMNLVMQFRKVCNHPDIFHSRDITSPFFIKNSPYLVPRLIYESFFTPTSARKHLKYFYSDLNIHTPGKTHRSLCQAGKDYHSAFSFLPLIYMSAGEYWKVFSGNISQRFEQIQAIREHRRKQIHCELFSKARHSKNYDKNNDIAISRHHNCPSILLTTLADIHNYSSSHLSNLTDLLFTKLGLSVFGHLNHTISCVIEDNNLIPCNKQNPGISSSISTSSMGPDLKRTTQTTSTKCRVVTSIRTDQRTSVAKAFVGLYFPKAFSLQHDIQSRGRSLRSCNSSISEIIKRNPHHREEHYFLPIHVPDRELLVADSGKLQALDMLLRRLKDGGHRVLIYSQMTKMIDILEEYMLMRRHMYVRLDGSCRISSRRDSVAGFQSCNDIFVFLLSTRAGGLGINLTAADTVIFYDSDWNPTVDQQAMDRAHRLGQTRQVTVYRLVCKGTVDERMLARAEEKSAIQRMVIQDGCFKSDSLNQKEMVSLLLDDEQLSKSSQRDDILKSLNKPPTLKRRYRKNIDKDGKAKKRSRKRRKSETEEKSRLQSVSKSEIVNISSKSNSPESDGTCSANASDPKNSTQDDQLIVVDDGIAANSAGGESLRGRRKRGRPRIRPIIGSRKTRILSHSPIQRTQRRWRGSNRRGTRGRYFSGRAAAMAGARAGAVAASAATLHGDRSHYSSEK